VMFHMVGYHIIVRGIEGTDTMITVVQTIGLGAGH